MLGDSTAVEMELRAEEDLEMRQLNVLSGRKVSLHLVAARC